MLLARGTVATRHLKRARGIVQLCVEDDNRFFNVVLLQQTFAPFVSRSVFEFLMDFPERSLATALRVKHPSAVNSYRSERTVRILQYCATRKAVHPPTARP